MEPNKQDILRPAATQPQPDKTAAPNSGEPDAPAFHVARPQLAAALYSYALGWFYVCGFWLGAPLLPFRDWYMGTMHPAMLGVFCLAFFGGAEWFLRRAKRPAPRESFWWLGFAALLLADLLVLRPLVRGAGYWQGDYYYGFYGWEVFALHLTAMYWLVCRAGLLTGGQTGPFALVDAAAALLGRPFRWFFLRIQVIWHSLRTGWARRPKAREKRDVMGALAVMCILVPLFCLALALLTGADQGFARLLEDLLRGIALPQWRELNLVYFILSLPVGAYLYGALGSVLRQTPDPEKQARWLNTVEQNRCLSKRALTLGLGAFCVLYLAFFAVQAGYLFGAFWGRLPVGFTAAEYARQGFFQLCCVVVLNFALLVVAAALVKGGLNGVLRGLLTALMGANLLFAVVSAAKMALYVSRFGFTDRRVLSSWAMLVLALCSLLAILRLFKPFPLVRRAVFLAAGLFAALCLCQPQYLSYRANLALYQNGVIQQLDAYTLRQQRGGGSEYRFARDLLAAGWGPGLAPEDIQITIQGYGCSGDDLIYTLAEDGSRQARLLLEDGPEGRRWHLWMQLDDQGLATRLWLTAGQQQTARS